MAFDASPLVSEMEIVEITGGYKRAADQYAELQLVNRLYTGYTRAT